MLSQEDLEFIQHIDAAMAVHGSLRKAVQATGENYDAVYARINRLGYRVAGRLMPINAPMVEKALSSDNAFSPSKSKTPRVCNEKLNSQQ